MTNIIVAGQIFCPFCDEPMQRINVKTDIGVFPIVLCREDKIFCYEMDPAFNKWRDTDKTIECPRCFESMRWFTRMLDEYMKCLCPKCGMGYEKTESPTLSENGQIEIPDFVENQAQDELETIYIPIDKLPISAERKAQYKHQIDNKKRG